MRFLLDTDICVFWLRGNLPVRNRMSTFNSEDVGISIISLAELRYGANCSTQVETNHAAIDSFVSNIPVLGVDQDIARTYANLKAELRKTGLLIEDLDLFIAATARTHGLILVSNNTDHFRRIPGLSLESWVQP